MKRIEFRRYGLWCISTIQLLPECEVSYVDSMVNIEEDIREVLRRRLVICIGWLYWTASFSWEWDV